MNPAIAIWFNYGLLTYMAVLAVVWIVAGDWKHSLYWLGGFVVNLAATLMRS